MLLIRGGTLNTSPSNLNSSLDPPPPAPKMVVKIYGITAAVCPQRVMHCLIEKGVGFEIVHVDLDSMEHKQPEYMAKQPFGQVPYIEDGDFNLYESRAIARYYAGKYAGQGADLLGHTPEDHARVNQWLDVEAINYNSLVFPIVLNLFVLPKNGAPGDPDVARESAEKLANVLDLMDRQLAKTKYLAGGEFTLADLTFIPATQFLVERCGMASLITDRKHVRAWWEDITGRPAWKKVMSMMETNATRYYP